MKAHSKPVSLLRERFLFRLAVAFLIPVLLTLATARAAAGAVGHAGGRASTRSYAVEVSATVQESPPRIDFSWPADATAEQYFVFRKSLGDSAWGPPLDVLSGAATSYSDGDVSVGVAYEYSFRKSLDFAADTLIVAGGTPVTFTVRDLWGDGLCCHHGRGSYEVTCDGLVEAEGGAFKYQDATSFTAGDPGGPVEIVVSLLLDVYAQETSWTLTDDSTGDTLAEGGPYEPPRFGHIFAGIRYAPPEDRGAVLLLVASDVVDELPDRVARLEVDLICDGYRVRRSVVEPSADVPDVKAAVVAARQSDPSIGTVFILGSVPVPYSGNIQSGHPDHVGAWPADVYYGEIDGPWTDESVDNTSASRPQNHNVPGDGKFDQTFLPSDVDLEVGRVDLHDLPAFNTDEYTLLAQYLDKNHEYRRGVFTPAQLGLVDDNLGEAYGTAPACLGWRNFTATSGSGAVTAADYFGTLATESRVWSYGVGAGSYSSCNGVGTTYNFVVTPVKTVFTGLFGSYFGDWDSQDNLLRAALANAGWPLASFWGGRPTWLLHRMALGRSIGEAARLTQNNDHLYVVSDGGRQIVPALLGDPTLRLHVAEPPGDLSVLQEGASSVRISWRPSDDADEGYHVYRAPGVCQTFERLTALPVADTTFVDGAPLPGQNVYMVRALKLETSGGGSYCNLSAGTIDSLASATGVPEGGSLALALPNPFPRGGVLRYYLPVPGRVAVTVYGVSGRRVRGLVDRREEQGWHTVRWDGRDESGARAAAGVYFLKCEADGARAVARATMLR